MPASAQLDQLRRNLDRVRDRIAAAATSAGRNASDIRLVAVTKYVDIQITRQLVQLGCTELGESRPQQLWAKAEVIPEANWHLIGHLQRNKVKRTLPPTSLIHSVDSLRLLNEIEKENQQAGSSSRVLLEVNVSGDDSKHGFAPDRFLEHAAAFAAVKHVEIVGLMAMSSREGDENTAATEFERLRILRDELQNALPGDIQLNELSMGMSGDFEIAIAQGSTIVRIGSALFEGVETGG